MFIKDYFKFTEDTEVSREHCGTTYTSHTNFGNSLTWDPETNRVTQIVWTIPFTKEKNILVNEEQIQQVSGSYFLRSYGDNMRLSNET